jgi:hypothetical protein
VEPGADAGEEVEARARHLGAALEVEGAQHPAELDVVARLEVELRLGAAGLEDLEVLLTARGRLVGREVGDRHDRVVPRLLGLALRGLETLDLGGEVLDLGEQRLLLLALRGGDLLAPLLLLGPACLEVGDRLAACGVGGERTVDVVAGEPALGLGCLHAVGVVTQHTGVDHGQSLCGRAPAPRSSSSPCG